jgi:hypothetical protein
MIDCLFVLASLKRLDSFNELVTSAQLVAANGATNDNEQR